MSFDGNFIRFQRGIIPSEILEEIPTRLIRRAKERIPVRYRTMSYKAKLSLSKARNFAVENRTALLLTIFIGSATFVGGIALGNKAGKAGGVIALARTVVEKIKR